MENITTKEEKTSDDIHMLYEGILEFESRLEKIKVEIDNLLDGCSAFKKCSFFTELIQKTEESNTEEIQPKEAEEIQPEEKPIEQIEVFEPQIKYFGSPSGDGFEQSHQLPSRDNPKTLFVIEQIAPDKAKFYPMKERFHRLKSNCSSLLEPVCIVQGNISISSDFSIDDNNWGELELEDSYWKVTKKCVIICSE